ncbi:MAG: UvrD-helicase domain-containing protein [Acidimicrobiales bacterium]
MPTETVGRLLANRPAHEQVHRILANGEVALSSTQQSALDLLKSDLEEVVAATNAAVLHAEFASRGEFFATIEKSPLTEEQARAVVSFDNRVQVLAAAGSGKTSVMVARAAYAVSRGFVNPERILLLAFNKDAASELQQRIESRFAGAGIASTGVQASTFHSFGLGVIGKATGVKPRVASWLEHGDGVGEVGRIVDELSDRDAAFRYRWDLFRLLFAKVSIGVEEDDPDGWDAQRQEAGYRTFAGEVVRSHGERLIADFLYLNGVRYEYERTYPHEVADSSHGQYRPDFYYPDIDLWHEHWAVGRDGKPPASFRGYAEAMEWKRRTHSQFGTSLVETTFAGVVWGDDLTRLGEELTSRGLELDWNPDRPPTDAWARPLPHEDMYRLVRTFMCHAKSNSWSRDDLEDRLRRELGQMVGYRTQLFLDLYWPIAAEWERRLATAGSLDFEDMLVEAARHLESGRVDLGYELVMVDEFQDASQARARLVRGLLAKPGRYLLAVGDDWQAINCFAGADLSVMTDFSTLFGRGPQLALTTTFRCPQSICDVARWFVSKNPRQFRKAMRSAHPEHGVPIDVVRSQDPALVVARYLKKLSDGVADGTVAGGQSGKVSVDILGRYRHEAALVPRVLPPHVDVTFRTVHGSKGLEADYVVVPNMVTGTYGFPSTISDDPVLRLAMPTPDAYQHAEERRLLYVALTRARRAATLITDPGRMSPFVVEMIDSGQVTVDGRSTTTPRTQDVGTHDAGAVAQVLVCPDCRRGTLVRRSGRYGPFLGCSTFPRCRHTQPLGPGSPAGQPPRPTGRGSQPPGRGAPEASNRHSQ